jgi:hypothetical protein
MKGVPVEVWRGLFFVVRVIHSFGIESLDFHGDSANAEQSEAEIGSAVRRL